MTGAWVLAAAVLLALGFGLYRRALDGNEIEFTMRRLPSAD